MAHRGPGKSRLRYSTQPRASTNMEARNGVLPAGFTFSRASGATYTDYRGQLATAATDVLRYNYDPSLTYNQLADPWFDQFTVGGAAPNLARFGGGGGTWTNTVTAKGFTSDGLPFVTVRGQSTPSNTNAISFSTGGEAAGTGIPAVLGDTVAGWARMRLDATSGLASTPTINIQEAADTFLTGTGSTIQASVVVGQDYTVSGSRTLTNASATQAVWAMRFGGGSVGVPVDVTVTLVFPVLNRGATPLTDTVPVTTLAARVGTTPQYGLEGALVERISATNGVRNPRAEGLATTTYAAGLPTFGTDVGGATNWRFTNRASGVAIDVSPISFAGRTGMRVRWYGTTSGSPGIDSIEFELRNVFGAQAGVPITGSFEVRLAAGTVPVSQFNTRILTFTNAGAVVDNTTKPGADLPIATIKTLAHGVTPGAGVSTNGWANVGLVLNGFPASTAVDFTIDIFNPQIETNSFASSRILPPVGVPAAATRAADIPNIDPSLIDLDKSSIAIGFRVARGGNNVAAAAVEHVFSARDATGANIMRVMTLSGQTVLQARATRAASSPATMQNSPSGSGVFQTVGIAWGPTDGVASWNGVAVGTAQPSPIGPATTMQIGSLNNGEPGNNTLKFIRIWKGRRLTDAQLQREAARTT